MTKYFIAILILFAAAGIVYRLSVDIKSKENVLLKTYTNDELGFSLAYPQDRKITIGDPIIVPKDANKIDLLSEITLMEGSGKNALKESFKYLDTRTARIFYIKTGQFEGVVSYKAYIFKDNFVVPIFYSWSGVDWTNPKYDSEKDSEFEIFTNIMKSINFIHTESGQYEGLR